MVKYEEMLIDWNRFTQMMKDFKVGDSFTSKVNFSDNSKVIMTCSIRNTKNGPNFHMEASLFDKDGCECDCLESDNVSEILGKWRFVNELAPYKYYDVKMTTKEYRLVEDYDRE